MRLENEQGWIEIEFDHYAEEGCYMRDGLFDAHNSVEIGFNFSIEGIGWGSVGDEYVQTSDIAKLAEGAASVLNSKADSFSHLVLFPYKCIGISEFCRFDFARNESGIAVHLHIWDGLCEYIELTQILTETSFADIADELRSAANRFPVR